jgi:photosystem II stability/assembly factor-like uncharacterized protein
LLLALWGVGMAQGAAQELDSKFFSPLHWRLIGPFRAGRVTSVAGVSGQPNVYYFGTPGGGIWKTLDAGRTWQPIFDQQPVAGIGAIAVAPSDPNTIYAGTGHTAAGDGVYKSIDAGASWTHVGLDDTRFIQAIIVDPRNPNIAVAGANSVGQQILWRPIPKSAFTQNRGVFKTTDGGKTWKKTLAGDDSVGVVDLCADPNDARKLYAVLYHPASGHGESGGVPRLDGAGDSAVDATSDIFISTDEGSSWKQLATRGLPDGKKEGRGRLGISVAPGNRGRRLYATLDQGFYRSDDGGANWERSTKDPRIIGSEYFSRVFVDPLNPDVLYVSQTSFYRSTDGGHTFEAFVGAPSGDDFHVLWIDPHDSKRMLLGVDQGAIITVNGGQTWGSWYNQPTGEFYHVSTDTAFPYNVYGAQQDSGTASVASRSDYGEITDREFMSIAGFEYCFIAPDPLHNNLVYSGGWYGTVVRFDKTNGQVATIFEPGDRYRTTNMAPLLFAPRDPHTLYLGTQFVMKTSDAGKSWQELGPDLTGYVEGDRNAKRDPDTPPPPAISALAVSSVDAGVIWAGTTNQIVQVTRDGGKSWGKVSPPGLAEPLRILAIEASRFDVGTAYVVAGSMRGSVPPYIARTRDFGHTWQSIIAGLGNSDTAEVVREDPVRKGLLYAGTQARVYMSFDDGDHWQPLQLNMPVVSVTDLEVHGNDLVASTYGRALWILDDLAPIRSMSADKLKTDVELLPPAAAIRVRWDSFQDTPYPPETPAGKNPPDGAIIDYFLKAVPVGDVTLTVYDDHGHLVRRYSSADQPPNLPLPNVPEYWFGYEHPLPKETGLNRFVWDLRYPSPQALPYSYYGNLLEYTEYTLADHAIPGDTPREQPQGPLVVPGNYVVELSAAGKTVRQPLTVTLDPRLHVSAEDLQAQLDLMQQIARGLAASYQAFHLLADLRTALADRKKLLGDNLKEDLAALEKKIDAIDKGTRTAPGFGPANRDLTRMAGNAQSADVRPADTVRVVVEDRCQSLDADFGLWRELNGQDLAAFNTKLQALKLAPLPVLEVPGGSSCAR